MCDSTHYNIKNYIPLNLEMQHEKGIVISSFCTADTSAQWSLLLSSASTSQLSPLVTPAKERLKEGTHPPTLLLHFRKKHSSQPALRVKRFGDLFTVVLNLWMLLMLS